MEQQNKFNRDTAKTVIHSPRYETRNVNQLKIRNTATICSGNVQDLMSTGMGVDPVKSLTEGQIVPKLGVKRQLTTITEVEADHFDGCVCQGD